MVRCKRANFWDLRDCLAARRLKNLAAGQVGVREHLRWWWAGGWESMWFAVLEGKRIGYARMDKNTREVSMMVEEKHRRNKAGTLLLRMLRVATHGALIARIKQDNRPSVHLFHKAGYRIIDVGCDFIVMKHEGYTI